MNGIKTVRRTVGTAVALVALSLSTAGCIEELRQGGKVSFTASTSYLNGGVKGETKTIYDGGIQSSSGVSYERINWVTGDEIKIYCEQTLDPTNKTAVYTVTAESSHSGSSDKAKKIEATPPEAELYWDMSGGKHHFFAAYPSSMTFNTNFYNKDDLIVMEHSVPETQKVTQMQTKTSGTLQVSEYVPNMDLVAMGAYSGINPNGPPPSVELKFMPLVTTLCVRLLAGDDLSQNNNLTMLQLKSSSGISTYPLAGSYKVAIGDYNNHQTPDVFGAGSGSVDKYGNTGFKPFGFSADYAATENIVRIVPDGTVFPETGIQLDATNPTAFTFVMLPVADMQLTLELTFGGTYDATTQTVTGGTTRSLALKNGGAWWNPTPRRKNYLNNLTVDKTWTGGTNPYNPGGGNGGDADFTYTVLPASRTIWTGESFTLSASSTATPAPDFTYEKTTGTSLLTLIATSTPDTVTVTALSTPGQAVVTVKAKRGSIEKTDKTCAVTVYKLKDMAITNTDATENAGSPSGNIRDYTLATPIAVGGACTLTPRVTYEDGTGSDKEWTGGTVVWKIADGSPADVVTVAGGVVTARKAGTTTVEGTITKGSVTRTVRCTVTVIPVAAGTEGYGKGNTAGF